jgi:mRNA-degrading endonuclease RelE of RelBE toxin-antitoxin system
VVKDLLAEWAERIDFKTSARREFLGLPPEVRERFFQVFDEFSAHPQRRTSTLDVSSIRNDPSRWRLKVEGGYRGIYRMVHGRPKFEMFQSRQEVYEALRRYLTSTE